MTPFLSGQTLASVLLLSIMGALGWPLRGQFGHVRGALIPGALFACAIAVASPGLPWRRAFGFSVLLSAAGFALGGTFGYGDSIKTILEAPHITDALGELTRLGCLGAIWGGLGGTALGLASSERGVQRKDLVVLSLLALAWFTAFEILRWEERDLILFGGGLLAFHVYNAWVMRSRAVAIYGIAGAFGIGLGFTGAVFLLTVGSRGLFGHGWPWWHLRDQLLGACGGIGLALAHRATLRRRMTPASDHLPSWTQPMGIAALVCAIPFLNALNVFDSWRHERQFIDPGLLTIIQIVGLSGLLILGFAWGRWARSAATSEAGLTQVIVRSTLLAVWILTILAISKETVPLGLRRWEAGFSLFLITAGLLTLWLPRLGRSLR